jgi:ligand-binding sensor domain-containing protein
MKKILILGWIVLSAFLYSQNWQTINNVNHVYDIEEAGNSIYFSSWGGVMEISGSAATPLAQYNVIQQLSTGDGLTSNDIRNLSMIDTSESLWMGSSYDGISVLSSAGIQNLGTDLGLPSLRVNRILESDSYILVATSQGLSVFYYLSGVQFPLMLHQYNVINTSGALPNNNVNDMMLTESNLLFMAHDLGISYVPLDSLDVNSAWKSLTNESPIPSSSSYHLTSNPEYIAVAANGLVYLKGIDPADSNWQVIRPTQGNGSWDISAIHLSSDNQLWIAFGKWDESLLLYTGVSDTLLLKMDLDTMEERYWTKNTEGFGYNHVSRIKTLEGKVYLCTWGDGIARLTAGDWEYFNPDNIAFPKITMSKADQNNALWFVSGIIGNYVVRKGTLGVSAYKDGHWITFNRDNSPLHSNNILNVEVDAQNRKWFGAWDTHVNSENLNGLTIYDERDNSWKWMHSNGTRNWNHETNSWGPLIPGGAALINATIGGIYRDLNDNMLVLSYNGGVNVIDAEDRIHSTFRLPNSTFQRVLNAYHNGRQYFFGTEADNGISIWNHNSLPVTGGAHWVSNIVPELRIGKIFGVASVETPYNLSGWQHFIASGSGLYMWDEYDWYKYDVYIKRYRFDFARQDWINDTLYYADEERLFGSVRTSPLSIYGDPFGRIWIGSEDNGMSMYNPITERFTNYFQGNAPLLSNQIISLGYAPLEGRLLIGTSDGLNTLRIGRTEKPETSLSTLKAYPNPFRPDGRNTVQIVNQPADSMPAGKNECSIYSASGSLIRKLKESPFSRFEWDGTSESGKIVSSGVYYFVVTDSSGKSGRGKIAIIR